MDIVQTFHWSYNFAITKACTLLLLYNGFHMDTKPNCDLALAMSSNKQNEKFPKQL